MLDWIKQEAVVVDVARAMSADGAVFRRAYCPEAIWRELLLSLVSSQVRWKTAEGIATALCAGVPVSCALRTHRFRNVVSRHVDSALRSRDELLDRIFDLVFSETEPKHMRREVVRAVPGIGPKQGSMFLRNIGIGHRIAVLDSHVVRFLSNVGILKDAMPPRTISAYEAAEGHYVDYALAKSLSPDILDVAIWATMRSIPRSVAA